jgi:4-hydroxy-4-methyl-2-oxoglutarate aldolase
MIHAAVEQCGPGDILVVATTSRCTDGMFGELLATSLRHRGVLGVVIDAGVRDTGELRRMGFSAWSRAVCVQGTVKSSAGAVNVDIVIGGQVVHPGDVILADDDGVVVVERLRAGKVAALAARRSAGEAETRAALAAGELGLDRYRLREVLDRQGVQYVAFSASGASGAPA